MIQQPTQKSEKTAEESICIVADADTLNPTSELNGIGGNHDHDDADDQDDTANGEATNGLKHGLKDEEKSESDSKKFKIVSKI